MHDTRLHGANDWRPLDVDGFPPRYTIMGAWLRLRELNPDPSPASPYDDAREVGLLWRVADAYVPPTPDEVDALFAEIIDADDDGA